MRGRTILKRVAITAVAAIALVYVGDTLSVWHRMSKHIANDPLTTLTTQPIIEIPHKDGRAEIVLGQAQTQTCVRSLFPHSGYSPCWYVARQNQSPIVMMLLLAQGPAGGIWLRMPYPDARRGARVRLAPPHDLRY